MIKNTKEFVEKLKQENEILEITEEVDPHLELAEIQRRVVAKKGPALLFTNVKGSKFPVATNLYGSEKRIEIAFTKKPEEFIKQAVHTAETIFPPSLKKIWDAKNLGFGVLKMGTKKTRNGKILDHISEDQKIDLIPKLKCWPKDGGGFITLPLVYTESPITKKPNLGMYRVQLFDNNTCGMHIQIHRGGGYHLYEAEKQNQSLPVHIYVGGPPALTVSAILPLPEDVPEILFASLLLGERLKKINKKSLSPYPILADSDFCIVGKIPPHKRKPEGPFGDHYGYYALQHDYPYVNVERVLHQNNAIYPATVVGRPPQEDHYLACYLQDLLKPLIKLVMPQVKEVWAYEESGVHSLAGAIVKDRYPKEAFTSALRIMGEGQLSLSKVLMVTDQDCDVKNFKEFFTIVLERIDFMTELFILSNISQDTLDYTGPAVNKGSKAIFLGVGEKKYQLTKEFSGCFSSSVFSNPKVFCPGALVVSASAYKEGDQIPEQLLQESCIQAFRMIFIVDDSVEATKSTEDFIWHVFTRFEPAGDVYAKEILTHRFHVGLKTPVVVDCRLKPWYPDVLESDPDIVKKLKPIFEKYDLN